MPDAPLAAASRGSAFAILAEDVLSGPQLSDCVYAEAGVRFFPASA
jgi:hypothetical protein